MRKTALDAFSHSELPVEILLKELYVDCDIGFTLQTTARSSLELDGLQVERIKTDRGGRTTFLRLAMIQGDENLTARLDYNSYIFEAATIQRMLGDLQSLLEGIVADPEQRISGLPLLDPKWSGRCTLLRLEVGRSDSESGSAGAYDTLEEGLADFFELDRPGRWWEAYSRESKGFPDAYCPRW